MGKRESKGWGGARKGAGRKPLPAGERQNVALLVRMRPEEVRRLHELAARAGEWPGAYVREIIRRHLRRVES